MKAPPIPDKPRWWQWPTVLSLDAPVVAVLWQWEASRLAGARDRLSWALVLGVSVWLAYAADRWIEAVRLEPERIRTARHSFYGRQRVAVGVTWVVLLAADVSTALVRLDRRSVGAGLVLLAAVAAYLLSHQLVHRHHRWRVPKEACVALLLTAGVALFPLAAPGVAPRPVAVELIPFLLLCFANCALISSWEREVDESHGQTSLARQAGPAAPLIHFLAPAIAAGSLGLALRSAGPEREAALCAAGAGFLLFLVDRFQGRGGWRLARVLADAALMTPAAALLASHLHP
jgi:hypothetical protein